MISVEQARDRILAALPLVGSETVGLSEALGRVLAEDVTARVSHPPTAMSAMDGYAVRAADVAAVPTTLAVIGESAAGRPFDGSVGPGQAARIFTGAAVPQGADAIVIQENATAGTGSVTVNETAAAGTFVRPAGLDFSAGRVLLRAGKILSGRDVGLIAAMNVPWLSVRRRPRIAILSTGDEIVMPGDPLGPSGIIGSNGPALAAFVTAMGGQPVHLGIAKDSRDSLLAMAAAAKGCDMLVTTGGASEGDHDLVRDVLGEAGMTMDFYKVAMRPGKPLMFGNLGGVPVLGLPGNPVSAYVCSIVFLGPAMRAMRGLSADLPTLQATLTTAVRANDARQEHLRAVTSHGRDGALLVTPFDRQDSAMMARLAEADCLIVRPPFAPAAAAGSAVPIITLGGGA